MRITYKYGTDQDPAFNAILELSKGQTLNLAMVEEIILSETPYRIWDLSCTNDCGLKYTPLGEPRLDECIVKIPLAHPTYKSISITFSEDELLYYVIKHSDDL